MMEALWQYFLVFVFSATPWIEILLVIPAALAMGLDPWLVGVLAFAGNTAPIFILVYGYDLWRKWRAGKATDYARPASRRRRRALRIWNRYGLPGLSLLAPALTGIHLAVLIALAFRTSKKDLLVWMNISLVVWTTGLTLGVYYGIEGLRFFTG